MEKYVCCVCGYVYDPVKGDSSHGVTPGTHFSSLSHGWVCPICNAIKDNFCEVNKK